MAFGQGMDVKMLQKADSFFSVINGGVYYKPTVISGTSPDGGRGLEADPTKVIS